MTCSKLVRDEIPKLVHRDRSVVLRSVRHLADAEYLQALIEKLREETEEFAADPRVEELADIAEVVRTLTLVLTTPEHLEEVRQAKARSYGTFANRIWMTWEDGEE